jgi:hypothetical protein
LNRLLEPKTWVIGIQDGQRMLNLDVLDNRIVLELV